MLVVKTDATQGAKGTSILIVETEDLAGLSASGRFLDKIGMHAQDTSELFFDAVRVPADRLLGGTEGRGFAQLMSDLPYERLIVAVQAAATMEGALEATLAYAKSPQGLRQDPHGVPEHALQARRDRHHHPRGAHLHRQLHPAAAGTARWTMPPPRWPSGGRRTWPQQVLDECVQLHGGYGYMSEYLVARMYADARVPRIYGGTNEIMKELIARSF